MTQQEIKDTIKDLREGLKSSFTPEQFRTRMEAKIKELEAQLSSSPAPKPASTPPEPKVVKMTPSPEPKKPTPPPAPERKKSVPQPKKPEDDEYDCDDLIAQAKERRKKAKERANQPKKSDATKNKEKLEKVFENVKERAEDKDITKAELVKLISETKSLLSMLEKKLSAL